MPGRLPLEEILEVLREGPGVLVPLVRALRERACDLLAADQGYAPAQTNLGMLYDECLGIGQCDPERAVGWYRLAAKQGERTAQYNLAVMYSIGEGVARDYWSARKWYRKAAEQGDLTAQYNLGYFHENGLGGSPDDIEAYIWYRVAAAGGFIDAQASLDAIAHRLNAAQLDHAKGVADKRRRAIDRKKE